MQKELARIGLDQVKRHPAVNWRNIDHKEDRFRTMFNRTPGAIGCYLSQMQVMLDAQDNGQDAVVLEDDLVFCSDFKDRMKIIEQFMDSQEWDVIWLGGTYHRDKPYWHGLPHNKMLDCPCGLDADYQEEGLQHFVRTWGAFSTHAYIVNFKSISKIIIMLQEQMSTSIGIDFSFIRMQPALKTYAFVPGCVKQIDNESDIGTGITHFSRFNKLGSHWWADKMSDYVEIKHRIELVDLLKRFNITGPSVELGVAEGLFSRDLLAAGIEFLYMIDNWGHIPGIKGDGNFPQAWHDKNYQDSLNRIGPYATRCSHMKLMTVDASREFSDNSFALVYHDADHSYGGVKADTAAWWPKIKPGGIMAFHDYFNKEYGVRKAVEEFAADLPINFILENKLRDAGVWIRKPE
jgi:GR25 family glycosyltransferase involved in LPS biosynthesis